MDINRKKNKRSRKERNSLELIVDNCLTTFLTPYINITNYGHLYSSLPKDFATKTTYYVHHHIENRRRANNMFAERSPKELLAVFNMTKSDYL